MNLTLQQLFGVNCIVTSQALIFQKSDLPLLTPSINNTAESLLIAILLKALKNFQGYIEDENGNPIQDENNNPIEFDNRNAYENLSVFLWEEQNFQKRGAGLNLRKTIVVEVFSPYES